MPMPKIPFENSPSTETPIDEENLNLMQDNIEEYVDDLKAEQFNSGIIQGTDNFNNYTKNGKFIYGGATTVQNNPGIWGIVEVMVTGTYILQRVTSASTNVEKTRYSTNNGTSWTSWRTMPNPNITTGVWTPVLSSINETSPTVSLKTQSGRYVKIGNIVFVQFYIQGKITALNGTNNYALVTGLPFTPKVITTLSAGLSISTLYNALVDDTDTIFGLRNEGIKIQKNYGANTAVWKTTDNFILAGSGCYEIENENIIGDN